MLVIQDYYQLLGIRPGATLDEIKRAYRQALVQNHHDIAAGLKQRYANVEDAQLQRLLEENLASTDARTRMLLRAHDTLTNPIEREAYDLLLAAQNYPGRLEIFCSTQRLQFGDIAPNTTATQKFWVYVVSGELQLLLFSWRFHSPLPMPRAVLETDLGGIRSIQFEVTLIANNLNPRRRMEALRIYCNREFTAALGIHYRITQAAPQRP